MPDLNNLGAAPSSYDVDFDNLPLGFGAAFVTPPQPGAYLFRLPTRAQIEKSFSVEDHPQQGKRLRCTFRDDTALLNITLNEAYSANMTNVTRQIKPRAGSTDKDGNPRKPFNISDLAMLLKAVGCIPKGSTVEAYKEAMLDAAEMTFLADSTLTATCNSKNDRYVYDEGQAKAVVERGVKGCGQRFRTEAWDGGGDATKAVFAIPRDTEGKFLLRFECPCGAEIRAWGQLQGFRQAK